jgi:hypothetical protein
VKRQIIGSKNPEEYRQDDEYPQQDSPFTAAIDP